MSKIVSSIMAEYRHDPEVAVAKMEKHIRNCEDTAHSLSMAAAYDKSLEWFEKYGQEKATEMILKNIKTYRSKRQFLYIDDRTAPKQEES